MKELSRKDVQQINGGCESSNGIAYELGYVAGEFINEVSENVSDAVDAVVDWWNS